MEKLTFLALLTLVSFNSNIAQVPITQIEGYLEVYHPEDNTSTFVGLNAGRKVNTAVSDNNTFFGANAGFDNTTGTSNSFFGANAGFGNTTESSNSFFGRNAGSSNEGSNNSFFGATAGRFNTGSHNVFSGDLAGNVSAGSENSFYGSSAGRFNTSGEQNSFLGRRSGQNNTTGSQNSFFGHESGLEITTGSGNICIGSSAGPTSNTANNLYIDNIESNTPLIYGEFDNDLLRVHGDFQVYRNNSSQRILRVDDQSGDMIMEFGRLGIGRVPATNKIEVQGTASKNSAGSWLANSDSRLKKQIKTLDSKTMLDKVLSMRGVSFNWDDDVTGYDRPVGDQIGFIAQDLQKLWPNKVSSDAQGYLQTAYGDFDPVFVEAIKAQQEIIEGLESEVTTLKEELRQIKDLLQNKD